MHQAAGERVGTTAKVRLAQYKYDPLPRHQWAVNSEAGVTLLAAKCKAGELKARLLQGAFNGGRGAAPEAGANDGVRDRVHLAVDARLTCSKQGRSSPTSAIHGHHDSFRVRALPSLGQAPRAVMSFVADIHSRFCFPFRSHPAYFIIRICIYVCHEAAFSQNVIDLICKILNN